MTAPGSLRTGPPAAVLRLHGISKSYAGRRVLHDVNLEVAAGECVALLGPNGAGKSTLLRIAANLTRPDAGAVAIRGTPAKHDAAEARGHLGYIGQEPALYDDLTPAEHLRLWARLHNRPDTPPGGTDAALGQAGLAAAAHKPTGSLSRGQRQRLGLALATQGDPAVLVLDEPFTALDARGAADLEAHLAARRASGTAILLTVHDEAQARRLATRRVRLDRHRLTEEPA